jgi:NADH-quinone oxidoreductase subunit G
VSEEKKQELVNVVIDGIPTAVPPGTNLLEAAKTLGVDVPHYCYHPGLSIAANCRMCMVETNRHPPGTLVPGCQIPVAEGMEITTESKRVKDQQRSVQEFLLLHHPVDCSICDQAGECRLQDYYQEYDFKPSRLDSAKWMKNKRKVLGPTIVLDQERCIMCTRCVRFMKEIAEEPVLGVFGRGTREVIDTFPGTVLDNNYSGNIVDLCPVGALLNRDTRFRARSYFLTATPSVCTGCSRGCNIYVDHFQEVPYRYRPRENPEVNQYWMCDLGRQSYHRLYDDRLLAARVDGAEVDASQATRVAAERLAPLAGKLAVVVSPVLSLEDALATMFLAKDGLGATEIYVSGRAGGEADKLLLRDDRNPNRRGVELAAAALGLQVKAFDTLQKPKVQGVVLAGLEIPTDESAFATWLQGVGTVVALGTNESPLAGAAQVVLPLAAHAEGEGTFVNFEGRAQRFLPAYQTKGASAPGWKWAGALLRELGHEHLWASAREVWVDLGAKLPAGSLGDFDWDETPKTHEKGVTPLSGGTVDGRPPGWRELIPLRTSGGSSAA